MYTSDFIFTLVPELPKLAWLATLDLPGMRLEVLHGAAVEIGDDWIVEGVWDGEFAEGGFHRTAHFFGSGIRIDGEAVHFVPSCALVDRLLYVEEEGCLTVSNSLPLILARLGAELDPAHDYRLEAEAIKRGIRDYAREFRVRHPRLSSIIQLFHDRLVVTRGRGEVVPAPESPRPESFDHYRELLRGVLARIRENYTAPERAHRVSTFTTISSGYDSPAVTALTCEIGVRESFTSHRSRSVIPALISRRAAIDDGSEIARVLGVQVHRLDTRRSRMSEDEMYFAAPSAEDPELVFHSMARHIEERCEVAVVFTGYNGGMVWDVDLRSTYLSDQIKRKDTAGLSLSEIRLKSGFINAPIPFLFARRVPDLVEISRDPEMEPWRLHKAYDRPIPRRILEEAGVPRQVFGMRKKSVVQAYNYPIHPGLRQRFFYHLRERFGWSPAFVYVYDRANRWVYPLALAAKVVRERLDGRKHRMRRINVWREVDLAYQMHLWALQSLRERMATVLREQEQPQNTLQSAQ